MAVTNENRRSLPRRRFPGTKVWGSIVLIVGIIGSALVAGREWMDPAIQLMMLRVAAASSILILWAWFVWHSNYSIRWRRFVGWCAPIGLLACVALLRIERTRGGLQLEFAWRWSPHRDQLLDRSIVDQSPRSVDLQTTTPVDFPQFLGPERNSIVRGIRLDPDWARRPPQLVWRQPIGAGWCGFSAVNHSAVTMEQRGDLELITCYDIATGKLNWSQATKARHATTLGYVGPRSTPTIYDGRVYALGATGIISCLNGADGAVIWRRDLLRDHQISVDEAEQSVVWGRAASPLVYGDFVVIPVGGSAQGPKIGLVALDRFLGEQRWSAGNYQAAYASPMLAQLDGVKQVLIVNEDFVSAHDPDTGTELWNHPWPGKSNAAANVSQPVPIDDSHVFLSKGYGRGAELIEVRRESDEWIIRSIWEQNRVMKTKFSNVALHGRFAYGLDDGILNCVDAQTGRRQWKKGRFGFGQNLLVEDLLLVLGESGELALVEATPDRFHELGRIQALEGQTWNTICLIGNQLLVRNAEMAACYQLATISAD